MPGAFGNNDSSTGVRRFLWQTRPARKSMTRMPGALLGVAILAAGGSPGKPAPADPMQPMPKTTKDWAAPLHRASPRGYYRLAIREQHPAGRWTPGATARDTAEQLIVQNYVRVTAASWEVDRIGRDNLAWSARMSW